jgi:hypothetical protein
MFGRPAPAWRQLLASPDFQLIAAVNAVIFTTNNGGRSVLMPLLAREHLAMKTSTLGEDCFTGRNNLVNERRVRSTC